MSDDNDDDDDMDLEEEIPWAIARIGDRSFGVHGSLVIEMAALKHVTELPGSPDYLRGIMKLRNDLIRTKPPGPPRTTN
ncbi:MAG: hypothetical protein HY579_00985 [Nitrospinae bacterium]|nr:hypothetical protein [Nitrospinota bacterium]